MRRHRLPVDRRVLVGRRRCSRRPTEAMNDVMLILARRSRLPLNIRCSKRCAKPVRPGCSFFEPTWYQSCTWTIGVEWSSCRTTQSPFGEPLGGVQQLGRALGRGERARRVREREEHAPPGPGPRVGRLSGSLDRLWHGAAHGRSVSARAGWDEPPDWRGQSSVTRSRAGLHRRQACLERLDRLAQLGQAGEHHRGLAPGAVVDGRDSP